MSSVHNFFRPTIAAAAEQAVRELMRVISDGGSTFVTLPLIQPDGSNATVKLDPFDGAIRVSDGGQAYRLLENVGAERSFAKTADGLLHGSLKRSRHVIHADVDFDYLPVAICEVGAASWSVVERVFSKLAEEDAVELEEHLQERLAKIFPEHVSPEVIIPGLSTTEWRVSAVVQLLSGKRAVFQAVSKFPISVHRASASFLDLSGLDDAPTLVAVVQNKNELGSRLSLITRAGGKVIQENQPDEVFVRAAA